jgi:hypothetical protein
VHPLSEEATACGAGRTVKCTGLRCNGFGCHRRETRSARVVGRIAVRLRLHHDAQQLPLPLQTSSFGLCMGLRRSPAAVLWG